MRRSSLSLCLSAAGGRRTGDLNPNLVNLGPEPEATIKALDAWAGVLCVLRFC